jgi:hypothetical protein
MDDPIFNLNKQNSPNNVTGLNTDNSTRINPSLNSEVPDNSVISFYQSLNKIETEGNKFKQFQTFDEFEESPSFLSRLNLKKYLKNINLEFVYLKQSELLFKILYDKYFRPELYSLLDKTSIITIKSQREKYKLILSKGLYFPTNDIMLNDPSVKEISSLNDEITFIKTNMKLCNYFLTSIILITFFVPLAVFTSFVEFNKNFKKIKYSKLYINTKPFMIFLIMNCFFINLILLFKIKDSYKMERNLEIKNKRMVEKYGIIFRN